MMMMRMRMRMRMRLGLGLMARRSEEAAEGGRRRRDGDRKQKSHKAMWGTNVAVLVGVILNVKFPPKKRIL